MRRGVSLPTVLDFPIVCGADVAQAGGPRITDPSAFSTSGILTGLALTRAKL